MSKFCANCGNELNDNDAFCVKCGATQQTNININSQSISRKCTSCGSTNISYQRETTASIGGSVHSYYKGHGCLYAIFIGWWIWIFKFIWIIIKTVCTCGLSLFFKKKKKIQGKTITASKNINRTIAVCQNCGNSWKI